MVNLNDNELIYQWAQTLQNKILSEGVSLSPQDIQKAKAAGIEHPDKVRILKVKNIILPDISLINDLKKANKLDNFATAGLALGYGIILNEISPHNVLYHELRHVAQYELFDTLEEFIKVYLKEVIKFGYGNGPFEIDANLFKNKLI